jgi:two-component system cell cycle sensor histidine kinase/response regulator CckA
MVVPVGEARSGRSVPGHAAGGDALATDRLAWLEQRTTELEQAAQRASIELARVSAELAQSHTTLERVTEAVPGLIYQMVQHASGELEFPFVSAAIKEMFGLEPADVQAKPSRLFARVHPEGLAEFQRSFVAGAHDRVAIEHEVQVRNRHDRWRWLRNRAVPRQSPEGTVWSGVAIDVTEQRSLAQQVQVTQTREAIGAVTAGIAHNFNNALAALIPNLEECLATAPASLRGPLQESLQVAASTAALVEQLMVVARGGATDPVEPVDVSGLVREVATLCRRTFRGRVEIVDAIEVEQARVRAQPSALRQVLLNLCINARDALQDIDGGRIELRLRVVPGAGEPTVELVVRDDGCGMDAATLQRLGEPFVTTKAPGQGTGLGLATAYATVRNLGGAIACASTLGHGTTFTVSLPLLDLGQVRAQAPTPAATAPTAARGRLLIVDDEQLVRSAIRKVLMRRGFEVDEAPDGSTGLARVREATRPYQGVLLDLAMPGISGERVLEQLRITHPDLPVVILSGFVEDPSKVASANAVLHKPLTSKLLVETLDRVLA